MKALGAAILVLLTFAAFSMTFLVAPLAVLLIFYVVYAMHSSGTEGRAAPGLRPHPGTLGGPEPAPAQAQARRVRITVAAHGEADDTAADDGQAADPDEPGAATPSTANRP